MDLLGPERSTELIQHDDQPPESVGINGLWGWGLTVILLDPENSHVILDGGVELLRVPLTSTGTDSVRRLVMELEISQRRDDRLTGDF
jgi:hypothetical protein